MMCDTTAMNNQMQIDIADIASDLYKDAYGARPRELFWNRWSLMSLQEKLDEIDYLQREVNCSIELESKQKLLATEAFERLIVATMRVGAPDRMTAIRWMCDGMGYDERTIEVYGYECVEYALGLPYGYINESLVE